MFDAWEHKDAMLADQAIRDFEYVQFLFNDNQASLGFRILALAAGIRFARAEGQEEVARTLRTRRTYGGEGARQGRKLSGGRLESSTILSDDWGSR